MLYTATAPSDVTIAGTTVYAVTNGITLKTTTNDASEIVMDGTHDDAGGPYRAFDASGSKFSFDGENSFFGFLDVSGGVSAVDTNGTAVTSRLIDGATAYTKIKNTTWNKVYFGVERPSRSEAWVYYYLEWERDDALGLATYDDIRFIKSGDTDDSGNQLTFSKLISHDINSEGFALVVYQDFYGNINLRASNSITMFGGLSPIATSGAVFADAQFLDNKTALLIDTTNDKVWLIHLDTTNQAVTLGEGIPVGDEPIAGVFNAIKSRFITLNKGSESLSVFKTKNEDGSVHTLPQVVATVNLDDLIDDKELRFSPNTITIINNTIVIGCENTTSLLLHDMSKITEITIADDDNDGDGYTGAAGDCDDSDAALNPTTVWYRDKDGDDYGTVATTKTQCEQPDGYVAIAGDCNNRNALIYPQAAELCDGADNDCDGNIDEDVTDVTWYRDSDGDGYGDPTTSTSSCSQPTGYVTDNTDCDDGDSSIKPGAAEVCADSADNNCDGVIDKNCYSM